MKPYYSEKGITIYHGDCRNIIKEIEIEKLGLLLTDPPYGMNYKAMNGKTKKNGRRLQGGKDWGYGVVGDDIAFDPTFLLPYTPKIIFGANHFASKLPERNSWIVWDKRGGGKPSKMHFGDCELAWSDTGIGIRLYSGMWHGSARWNGKDAIYHPTQKPKDLMLWAIKNYASDGCIFDPFMGSGTTLRAAKDLGRQAVGIEIEEKYCEIAVKRLAQEVIFTDA